MAEYIKSAYSYSDWIVDQKTEICLLGRSNVGKSSFINAMAKKKIAFVSKKPGKTLLANFYDFNKFRLVDLPGYGYAKLSKEQIVDTSALLNEYVNERVNIFIILHLIDSRNFTDQDIKFSKIIRQKFSNYFIVLTKIDKINKNELQKNINNISKTFKVDLKNILPISSEKNIGINEVYKIITKLIV